MAVTVLVVEDEDPALRFMSEYFTGLGYEVVGTKTLADAREAIKKGMGDIIILDVQLPDGYGPNLLLETAILPVRPPVIVVTGFGDIDMAVEAMKNGAHDFMQKPVDFDRLKDSVKRAVEIVTMRRELAHFREQQLKIDFVIGKNPIFQSILHQAKKAATASVSVLVSGETGTGKEVLARFIHMNGPRAGKSLIAINCGAVQSNLIESELFGYEQGAFTGAEKRRHGLIELADGGILFLDEIASMPLDMQAKLLRAIETRTFRRVGSGPEVKVDVQIVAASNRDLKQMMKNGTFREDLYYRLHVVDLDLPPLRERKEDIPELVGFFVRKLNQRMGVNIRDVTQPAMEVILKYSWPGNIRELSNAIERAMLFCENEYLDVGDLPMDIVHPR